MRQPPSLPSPVDTVAGGVLGEGEGGSDQVFMVYKVPSFVLELAHGASKLCRVDGDGDLPAGAGKEPDEAREIVA